ncbi:MAG: methyltransferase domain-containing protein [Gammaproteobacteria bacterium]|nr:methyltransferase domain-containing protein [Gammaproteobacteria bacterium]
MKLSSIFKFFIDKKTLDHNTIKSFVRSLYDDMSSSNVSTNARDKNKLLDDSVFVYGDTDLDSLQSMINYMQPKQGQVFYDLGCGGGQVVFYAALRYAFVKCSGVEFLEDLYNFALTRHDKFKQKLLALAPNERSNSTISFTNQDFTQADLSDADIIYTYSTCFDQPLMEGLARNLEKCLKPGTKVITVTKSLPSAQFKLLKQDSHNMPWGLATTWFYEKL